MNRVSNSYLAMSALLGRGRLGASSDDTANLIRTAALRADRAMKAAPAKAAELPAKATERPAVTVSLSQAAQTALAQARAAVQARPDSSVRSPSPTSSTPATPALEPEPQAAPSTAAPEAKTESAPTKPRSIKDIDFENLTPEDRTWLVAQNEAGRANHEAVMMIWRDLDSRDTDQVTPVEARALLAKLEPLVKASEDYEFKHANVQRAVDFLTDRGSRPDDYRPAYVEIHGMRLRV
ncbi:hypothetical protein [Caulobacter segnis]|uniref:hypothetical protein n=1 Tax=Caulobacter segnis TaxID=88688 RepID=UPI00285E60F8|nr:hypothetical protein [Caulobacter segnis]MDR6623980.1 hypothetical protein [Caulobacter segnis]